MDEEKRSKKKGFWSIKRIGFLAVLIIALLVGALFQHYVVEPFLNNFAQSDLEKALSENKLLNEENLACIKENNSLRDKLAACNVTT